MSILMYIFAIDSEKITFYFLYFLCFYRTLRNF